MAAESRHSVSGFHHVALRVRDFDASLRFYMQGLGLTQKVSWGQGNERAAMLDAGGGNCIEVFAGGGEPRPEGAYLHLAFSASDCDSALAAARAAGATVTKEPETIRMQSVPPEPFGSRSARDSTGR